MRQVGKLYDDSHGEAVKVIMAALQVRIRLVAIISCVTHAYA